MNNADFSAASGAKSLWQRLNPLQAFSLADALLLAALALLLVAFKAMVRLKLGLTGHSMFLLVLVFLLARGLVPHRGAVLYCGLMAGLLAMVMGVGKGGPLILLKMALPALTMEMALLLLPMAAWTLWQAVLVALAGMLAWLLKGVLGLWLAGAESDVILLQIGWKLLGGGLFSVLAALLVPGVMRKLAHHGLVTASNNKSEPVEENQKETGL
ncbi:hypothetical protein [Oceanospirillum sanctuarii]|uniref:hypothetical protein n=1 Tax=Oceanospirillum sanctuarii TaxID=1434821 RepID=UPI000A379280|nr:hypothetical protein [Oceanospirillum sanctuarii]